jgi:hypothetical protein
MSKPYLTASPEQRLATEIADLKAKVAALESRIERRAGFTGTVALAALTFGGTQGSMTLDRGVVTAYTAPT